MTMTPEEFKCTTGQPQPVGIWWAFLIRMYEMAVYEAVATLAFKEDRNLDTRCCVKY